MKIGSTISILGFSALMALHRILEDEESKADSRPEIAVMHTSSKRSLKTVENIGNKMVCIKGVDRRRS